VENGQQYYKLVLTKNQMGVGYGTDTAKGRLITGDNAA
jgi:hypothetical protein